MSPWVIENPTWGSVNLALLPISPHRECDVLPTIVGSWVREISSAYWPISFARSMSSTHALDRWNHSQKTSCPSPGRHGVGTVRGKGVSSGSREGFILDQHPCGCFLMAFGILGKLLGLPIEVLDVNTLHISL